jgi:AraC-like DNA-binding protein
MDPLDDVFAAMRVQTAMYVRLEATAPWGIEFAGGSAARFGFVVHGRCRLTSEAGPTVELKAGDCYVLVHGSQYALRDRIGSRTKNCFDVLRGHTGSAVTIGGGGDAATVVTGWFTYDELSARPLMQLLPPLLHAEIGTERTLLLESTLKLLALETAERGLGSGVVISRLADILFIQAIRTHVATRASGEAGWLAALTDARLGPVLRAIHLDTAAAWTVDALASAAGMSRSAFASRFKERVGAAPLEYVSRWRMFRAGAMLRSSDRSVGQIADEVGYDSEAAFAKAFKRIIGQTPGTYRRAAGAGSP